MIIMKAFFILTLYLIYHATMNRRSQRQMTLIDCQQHGAGSELFVVEGESAANAVSALCDSVYQAVLPLQGKPLNAFKVSEDKVLASPLYYQFAQALGIANATNITSAELKNLHFGKVFLLFDPDADGIHIGALFLLYLIRWLPSLLTEEKVYMLRTPMFGMQVQSCTGEVRTEFAYLPQQRNAIQQQCVANGETILRIDHFQSLGSVPPHVLESFCIHPSTRRAKVVGKTHIDAVVAMFG